MSSELAPGVWWLSLGWVAPFRQNAYLVDDGGTLTLVDAGTPWDARKIRSGLLDAGFGVADVDRVLITHYDLDHVGGLFALPNLDAPVYVGEADARLALGEDTPSWLHHKGAFHRLARRYRSLPERLPVERVADGDAIGGFVAYHTPGHNPGHTVYVHEERGVGLLGDLVWESDGELTTPIWFDSYDMDTLRESVRSFAARVPDFEIACMGHGEPLLLGGNEALDRLAATL